MTHMLIHDLKSPLQSIIGLAELEYQPQYHEAIYHSGQTMLKLVSNMLDVQKFEETNIKLQMSRVNLKTLFSTAYRQVAYLFQQKNIQFHLEVNENQSFILDVELIKRVMVNLLDNASKYTPNNGQVSVIVETQQNTQIKVSVTDNGKGIAPKYQKSIFDKYTHLDTSPNAKSQSTGLGLTFCKLAIEAHEGQINLSSQEGKGSTFWFTLPEKHQIDDLYQEPVLQEYFGLKDTNWSLTHQEKQILIPVAESLRKHEVFELSSIKTILHSINHIESNTISQWKLALEDSTYAGNEERFKELLDLINI